VVLRLAPAAHYGLGPSTFGDLVTAAQGHDEVALGYLVTDDMQVRLNPAKSASVSLGEDDRVVVISRV
jgi:hypothetical protein